MAMHLAVSASALCIVLCCAAPAAAYRVDKKTQRISIRSLRDFESCQQKREGAASEACLDGLRAYVKKHPDDAFEAGKLVRRHYMHWVALDFFAQALGDKPSKQQCADEDVSAAVVSGLALPPHYPAVALAQAMLGGSCRERLEPSVIAQLKRAGTNYRSNACALVAPKVPAARCRVSTDAAQAEPPPPPYPGKAELMAKAPELREAPPERKEPRPHVHAQRLKDVFRSVPGGQQSAAPEAAVAELRTLDWKLLDLDSESAELLRGEHGEELLMAHTRAEQHDYVLLKFKGISGPWNERVLVAVERKRGTGKDYVVLQDDQASVVLIERQRQYQAFPRGVTGGLWLNPVRPSEQAFKLPTRRQIASELAAAQPSE